MEQEEMLKGKTIGVINTDQLPELVAAVKNGLLPGLQKLGYRAAVNVTLPCNATGTCTQQEAAIQKMKAAGVDLVFMAAANTVGSSIVTAADNLDFHPTWAANGNQVTDTVAQFFDSVKDSWDGAIGTSTIFSERKTLSPGAYACNRIIKARSGEAYPAASDSFGQAAVICLLAQLLDRAGETVEPTELGQAAMMKAIERLGSVAINAGPHGSLSSTKHDAGDYLFVADYRAKTGTFIPRDQAPIKIDD
jgi:Periplasmic binding protein